MITKLCRWYLSRHGFKVLSAEEWNTHANAMAIWAKRAARFSSFR